jgi:hypothetical protein
MITLLTMYYNKRPGTLGSIKYERVGRFGWLFFLYNGAESMVSSGMF